MHKTTNEIIIIIIIITHNYKFTYCCRRNNG